MGHLARPTLRALTEDLGIPDPGARQPLDTIRHLLLDEARRVMAEPAAYKKLPYIDVPQMLWKLRVQSQAHRWRGAGWRDGSDQSWVVAAGIRRRGAPEDFYERMKASCTRQRRILNARNAGRPSHHKMACDHLLPTADDYVRVKDEEANRAVDEVERLVEQLASRAWQSPGVAMAGSVRGEAIRLQVLREADEVYLQVQPFAEARIVGMFLGAIEQVMPCLGEWDFVDAGETPFLDGPRVFYTVLDPLPSTR